MSSKARIGAATLTLVAMAAAAAACAGSAAQTSPARPVMVSLVSWGQLHGDIFAALSYDTSKVADDASTYNIASLDDTCQALRQDAQGYVALPPIPDVAAASHLSAALRLYGRGTADCIDATARGDGAAIVRAVAELNSATSQLNATRAQLDQSGGT